MTRQELRRAILLQEMLSPPISMREDEPAPEEAST
jgi:hypothetical protein